LPRGSCYIRRCISSRSATLEQNFAGTWGRAGWTPSFSHTTAHRAHAHYPGSLPAVLPYTAGGICGSATRVPSHFSRTAYWYRLIISRPVNNAFATSARRCWHSICAMRMQTHACAATRHARRSDVPHGAAFWMTCVAHRRRRGRVAWHQGGRAFGDDAAGLPPGSLSRALRMGLNGSTARITRNTHAPAHRTPPPPPPPHHSCPATPHHTTHHFTHLHTTHARTLRTPHAHYAHTHWTRSAMCLWPRCLPTANRTPAHTPMRACRRTEQTIQFLFMRAGHGCLLHINCLRGHKTMPTSVST